MWAIIYQAKLSNISDDNVLKDKVYIGQSIPQLIINEPEKILQRRRKQHFDASIRSNKKIGFMPLLKLHGNKAFDWIILEKKVGDVSKDSFIILQEWANEREKYYIKLNGGVLKDINKKLIQTLNLTSGGQGDPKCIYECRIARSNYCWHQFITHLTNYKEKNGHINIINTYICDDGYKLGNQIVSVRCGTMLEFFKERREILNNFEGWTWNIIDNKWQKFYDEIVKYKKQYGNCDVPQCYETEDQFKLGLKCSNIRQGQFITGYPERENLLTELGFKWCPLDELKNKTWDSIESYLQTFFNTYDHSNIPQNSITDDGFPIGHYITHIRSRNDFIKNDIYRIKFLESINFSWNVRVDTEEDSWNKFYKYIVDYKDIEGHCNVTSTYICIDGYKLGSICNSIRHKNQYMNDPIKKQLLEKIDFSWDLLLDKWIEFKNHILEYKNKFKNCKVIDGFITDDGYRLGQTVITVRHGTYINNFPDRKLFLDGIGFIWSIHDKSWNDFIEHLNEYIVTFKNCNIKRNYISLDGYKLGGNIHNIKTREQYIKNKPERKKQLLDLGLNIK